MKTFIFAVVGLLGLTLGAPLAEAKDKKHHHHDRDKKQRHHDHRDYRHHHHDHGYYRYDTPRYYSYPRSYGYYDNRYHRRPGLTFNFGF